jgi:hypothetical protein
MRLALAPLLVNLTLAIQAGTLEGRANQQILSTPFTEEETTTN